MNNVFFTSFMLISINSYLISYGAEPSIYVTHSSRAIHVEGTNGNVTIDEVSNGALSYSYKGKDRDKIYKQTSKAFCFTIEDDITIRVPAMVHYNKIIQVEKGDLAITGGKGSIKIEKKEGNIVLNPNEWGNTDVTLNKGDVSLVLNKEKIKFDAYVKWWSCMNNRSKFPVKWSYTWCLWPHYENEHTVYDTNAPIVKIWAKDGTLRLYDKEQVNKVK